MATTAQALKSFNDVVDSYHELLQMAHDALDADVEQEQRNSVQQTIVNVIADSKERRTAPSED